MREELASSERKSHIIKSLSSFIFNHSFSAIQFDLTWMVFGFGKVFLFRREAHLSKAQLRVPKRHQKDVETL